MANGLKITVLLDASAFIMGYEASDAEAENYTVPAVREEIKQARLMTIRLEMAMETGKLKVISPDPRYRKAVDEAAAELGELGSLSETDKDLLALALQLKGRDPVIVSDDYSVQNAAEHLGIRHRSLATVGIRRRFNWIIYCPGCRRTYDNLKLGDACPVCGTTLRRKPLKKTPLKKRMES